MGIHGAVGAEWVKLRSVRSTYWLLLVTGGSVVLAAALSLYVAHAWDAATPELRQHMGMSPMDQLGLIFAQLCMPLLGVLAVSSEYSSGQIRTTLAVEPRRGRVLAAKALVVSAVALVVTEVVVFGSYLVSRGIVGDRPLRYFGGSFAHDLPRLLAAGPVVVVFALVGLGLATVMRSAAGAIVSVVALWYVIPIVVLNLPDPWNSWLGWLLPANLGQELAGEASLNGTSHLPPLGAAGVMLAWVVAALLPAALLLRRRDA
jgi:ABC-2 type transport system permease protein